TSCQLPRTASLKMTCHDLPRSSWPLSEKSGSDWLEVKRKSGVRSRMGVLERSQTGVIRTLARRSAGVSRPLSRQKHVAAQASSDERRRPRTLTFYPFGLPASKAWMRKSRRCSSVGSHATPPRIHQSQTNRNERGTEANPNPWGAPAEREA